MRKCPLCGRDGVDILKNRYFECQNCRGIFLDQQFQLDPASEKARYETHNNDVNDPRYQKFVIPIVQEVSANHTSSQSGLDFGAGTGPVISKLLADEGYCIEQYDPFFHNDPALLQKKYDYIVSCEVIEHFYHPAQEFALLKKLMKSGATLYCMTLIYKPEINFAGWSYINDNTHVFFYQKETLNWITQHFNFSAIEILSDRLIKFVN